MRDLTGTHHEICCFLLTMQNRVYSLSLYLKVFHLKTVAMNGYNQLKEIHIAFNSAMLLYREAKNIPIVKVTANMKRKLELRDASLTFPSSCVFSCLLIQSCHGYSVQQFSPGDIISSENSQCSSTKLSRYLHPHVFTAV